MGNNSFENKLEQEMKGLQIQPSDAIWQQVEAKIQKEKKRKAMIWFSIMAMAIAGVGIQFLQDAETNKQSISAVDAKNVSGNNSVDIKDESSNELPNSENQLEKQSTNVSPLNDAFKNQYHVKDKHYGMNVNNTKDFNNINPASKEAEQNSSLETTKGFINKDNINEHPIAVEKKGNDTIVILRCEDIGKTKQSSTQIATDERQLNFNAHLAFHGTGDLSGTNLEFGTERKWGKRYSFYNNLGITIHSGQEAGMAVNAYPLQLNSTFNALQTVTFGIQTIPTIYRYSKRGDLKIGAGLVARYQMSSYGNYVASSLGQGISQYSYSIYENEPNTFSIGYRISADLLLYETKKNKLGFQIFFQNDTRGDVITGLGLSFQTKYKK
ncbi:MAG: hypothetical protein RL394_453 [Bacteroidota bacterium]|jgi:hypothetical protein